MCPIALWKAETCFDLALPGSSLRCWKNGELGLTRRSGEPRSNDNDLRIPSGLFLLVGWLGCSNLPRRLLPRRSSG